jgi:hypothetical protein
MLRVGLPPNVVVDQPGEEDVGVAGVETGAGLFWDDGRYCDDIVAGGIGPDRQDYVYEAVAGTAEIVEHHGLSQVVFRDLVLRADDENALWPVADGWESLPEVVVGDVLLPPLPVDAQRHDL